MSDLIQNPDNIQLTERHEILAIMGNPPGWILRWGISLVVIVAVALLTIGWVVEYPDTVQAKVELTTQNPPIPVMARADGKLSVLLVGDKDWVEESNLLGIIENPADLEDVNLLEEYLSRFIGLDNPVDYLDIPKPEEYHLGKMQKSYAALGQKLEEYQNFLKQRTVFRQMHTLKNRIDQTRQLNNTLQNQSENLKEEVELALRNYERNKNLFEQDTIRAEVEVEKARMSYLQTKNRREEIEKEILNNNISIQRLQSEYESLKGQRAEGRSVKETEIQEIVQTLKGEIKDWKQDFLLKAPIAGEVAFTKVWSANQPLKFGDEVMTIVPQGESGKVIGRAKLAVVGSGKVIEGQPVNIRLEAFPHQEFGILKGQVDKISLVPDESHYLIEIGLPDTLLTTYKKPIEFRQGMIGQGFIITEKRRFLERIFDKIMDAIYNK